MFERQLRDEIKGKITVESVSGIRASDFGNSDLVVRVGDKMCQSWRHSLADSVDSMFARLEGKRRTDSAMSVLAYMELMPR